MATYEERLALREELMGYDPLIYEEETEETGEIVEEVNKPVRIPFWKKQSVKKYEAIDPKKSLEEEINGNKEGKSVIKKPVVEAISPTVSTNNKKVIKGQHKVI